jgi:CRP-like cAMP-binding protein
MTIRTFRVFADLPAAEIDVLLATLRELEVDAGTNIVTVDDYGTAAYVVEAGTAEVLGEDGVPTETLGKGDTFGEIGLLLTGQRTATVRARTPMTLLSLGGADFDRIRASVPELERSLRRLGAERSDR